MCVFWRAFGVCSNIRARSHASLGSILTSIQCCKGLSGQHWINVIYFISSTRIHLKYTICKIKCFQFWIILWWMNYWSSFLNPISSDIVCLIIISIEFMSNYFEIMKYFEIALFKKFLNPVLLKLHANTKGYMLPKHVYCIPANWNFTLLESKLQILFFVLIKQANNQLFKQISRISFWGNFGWVC